MVIARNASQTVPTITQRLNLGNEASRHYNHSGQAQDIFKLIPGTLCSTYVFTHNLQSLTLYRLAFHTLFILMFVRTPCLLPFFLSFDIRCSRPDFRVCTYSQFHEYFQPLRKWSKLLLTSFRAIVITSNPSIGRTPSVCVHGLGQLMTDVEGLSTGPSLERHRQGHLKP